MTAPNHRQPGADRLLRSNGGLLHALSSGLPTRGAKECGLLRLAAWGNCRGYARANEVWSKGAVIGRNCSNLLAQAPPGKRSSRRPSRAVSSTATETRRLQTGLSQHGGPRGRRGHDHRNLTQRIGRACCHPWQLAAILGLVVGACGSTQAPSPVTVTASVSAVPSTTTPAISVAPTQPAAKKSFAGVGTEDLGTITVPSDSTLSWSCPSCGSANYQIFNSDPGSLIAVNALDQTNGTTVITCGTYHDVTVNTEGQQWAFTITPGNSTQAPQVPPVVTNQTPQTQTSQLKSVAVPSYGRAPIADPVIQVSYFRSRAAMDARILSDAIQLTSFTRRPCPTPVMLKRLAAVPTFARSRSSIASRPLRIAFAALRNARAFSPGRCHRPSSSGRSGLAAP
jgi:hypothetical protein